MPLLQPELMAIGDSLFNGVRSLTINGVLAQWSAPAQLAKALGIADFATPDYPRNVVINFENWVSKFPFVGNILSDLDDNVAFWASQPKSALPYFDNLAIAASTYADMSGNTWRTAQATIDKVMYAIQHNNDSVLQHLSDLYFAFNTRFILNPSGDPAAPGQSALEIVAARKPKRLVVCIGHNNGLWDMAYGGQASAGFGVGTGPFGAQAKADLEDFMAGINALPPDIEHIYINAMPRPGCTPTMMPTSDNALINKPGPGAYYAMYENRMGINYATLTGAQVKANDAVIDAANQRVAALAGPRVHVVPIDQFLTDYDWKTNAAAKTYVAGDGRVVSNLMFYPYWSEAQDGWVWEGGLCGLDGMHPTIVGYNIMAQTILDTIISVEGPGVVKGALPTTAQALEADKLLEKCPAQWYDLLGLILMVRKAVAGVSPPPGDPRAAQVKTLLQATRFTTN